MKRLYCLIFQRLANVGVTDSKGFKPNTCKGMSFSLNWEKGCPTVVRLQICMDYMNISPASGGKQRPPLWSRYITVSQNWDFACFGKNVTTEYCFTSGSRFWLSFGARPFWWTLSIIISELKGIFMAKMSSKRKLEQRKEFKEYLSIADKRVLVLRNQT